MSKNGSIICRSCRLSFIHKGRLVLSNCILLAIWVPLSYFVIAYWPNVPLMLKILWAIITLPILVGVVMSAFNGMLITSKGTILYVPDLRIKKFRLEDLARMVIVCSKRESDKYSVKVQIWYKNGKVFTKDYASQFANAERKRGAIMSVYTISQKKVDKICKQLSDIGICEFYMTDNERNVTPYFVCGTEQPAKSVQADVVGNYADDIAAEEMQQIDVDENK